MATGVLPSAEAALFDRSERLWGAESQKRLRSGKIVLLGATPCGCEALKNLVLPGLGSFVIVDDKKVELVDLGSNFFLEQQDAGKFRAEATAVILSELNPLCVGKADTRSVSAYVAELSAGTDSISGTVVVATSDVGRDDLIKASEAVSRRGGCLVHALTNGLFGVLRIQTPGYFVVSTMPGPDTRVIDLRPLQPFPELQAFIDRLNPEDATLSPEVHAHIPWFVVLNHAIRKWREVTGSSQDRPRTTAEWKKTKAIIEEYFTRVDPVSGARKMHDSFFEAQTWCSERVDLTKRNTPELRAVLNDPRAENPTCDLESTWFLAHALRAFRAKHGGQNPVAPKIPDFDATTEMYKELQVIFRHKAAHDAAELWAFAQDASAKVGGPQITQDEAAEFAAQSWEVNYVSAPTIADELRQAATPDHYSNGWSDDFKYLVAHRASLVYHEKRGYYPGFARNPDAADFASTETAVEEMAAIVQSLWPEAPIGDFKNRELAEWVRGGGCEIVTTASILGAVAGQECIKLLQRMRRPVVHTLLYNGIQAQFVTFGKA